MNIKFDRKVHPYPLLTLLAALSLAGCGGGGGGDSTASSSSSSMSSSVSSSSSSSSSSASVPPLASSVISLDDKHQVGATTWANGDTSTGGQGQPVGSLDCGTPSQVYHVHTHLSIYLNGVALAVPQDIGIVASPSCEYSTHTHDLTGIVHVESSAPGTFTLGQFFAIWGQPLSSTNVAGNSGLPVVVYITDNGVATQYTGDLATIELLSHREITIQIGSAITEIPRFTWTGT